MPFKVYGRNEIIYDTLFSERANLDIGRLILILVVISVAFAITLVLINSLHLNVKFQSREKLKLKPALYILAGVAIIAATTFLLTKKQNLFIKTEKVSSGNIAISAMLDSTSRAVKINQSKPTFYNITNVKSYSNEKFQEFVSFTFHNLSDEVISNIMFKEAFFPVKNKKNNFINKLITLQPKDSTKFTFKKDHDELFVYKIRFASRKTITFDDGFFNSEYMIYSKLGEPYD